MEEKKCKVLFRVEGGEDVSIFAFCGESLLDAAKRANLALDAPCAGNGTCGKCRVRILAGTVQSEPGRHISPAEFADGRRLACASIVVSDITVQVSGMALAYHDRIKVSGKGVIRERNIFRSLQKELKAMGLEKDSGLGLITVELDPPVPGDVIADRERLFRKIASQTGFKETDIVFSLHALRRLSSALRQSGFSVICVLRQETGTKTGITIMDVFPCNTGSPPVIAGLAIDLGTTTISALMVDLDSGEILTMGSAGNGQICYGADVISRIIESNKPGGLERLRSAVTEECVAPLIRDMSETAGLKPENIYRVAVAGNTAMTHLFLGISPEFLRL